MSTQTEIRLLIVALSLAVCSATASAQNAFSISGEWYLNRGANVNIPPGGGDIVCATPVDPPGTANALPAPCVRHKALGVPINATPNGAGQIGAIPLNGGAPFTTQTVISDDAAANPVTAVGNAFRLPPNLISIFPDAMPESAIPVVLDPVVQQLNTTFTFMAPGEIRVPNRVAGATLNGGSFATPGTLPDNPVRVIGPGQKPGVPEATRLMQTNAWSKAGQTSRVAPNFLWTMAGGPNPTRQISYTAGANRFGGTMHMLLGGTEGVRPTFGTVWVVANINPADTNAEVLASPLTGMGSQGQQPGRGYSTTVFRAAPPGQVFDVFNIPTPCSPLVLPAAPAGCGLITGVDVPLFAIPGATTINVGFPWTTGHVSVMVDYLQGANPRITTLTASGADTIVDGVRTVQLVAAGVSLRTPPGGGAQTRSAQLDAVTITLPEPGATLALAGVLGLIGVLYCVRSRFS